MTNEQKDEKKTGFAMIKKFFMIIGVLAFTFFLLALGVVIYLVATNPFGIKLNPLNRQTSGYDHPLLTPSQESALETIGVDLTTLPTSVTNEQAACAANAVGEDRANEIKAGATPGLSDYLKAKECFE